ncbi:MAG TPA: ABC transporter substrate-binding protein, partial [Spirochaetia bacterium]|nr:ABC transporter substrate-binding protein [Spirochaetia bacterium]
AGWVGNDKGMQQLVADPLWTVEYTLGQNVPTLASDPPIYNKDFTRMTAKLRKGVTWSDGVPFTADDVVYTVQVQMANKGMTYYAQMTDNVAKVSKTDDYTVVFDLKKPNAKFDVFFNDRWGALRILPKHIWEKQADPMTFQFYPPVGTGPYVLKDYDTDGYWFTYERRADWDKSPAGMLYGKPAPTYVQFVYYGDPDKKVIAESQHQLDMCDLTPEAFVAAQKKVPTVRGLYKDFPWYEILHPCTTGGVFNCQVAPYNDADVRWALNLALNIPQMVMTAYNGATALAPAYVPATLPFYKWYYQPMQQWLKDFTITVGGKPYKPYDPDMPNTLARQAKAAGYPVPTTQAGINEMFGYGGWKYDPAAAETLLKGKGFSRDKNGKWLLPDGKPWSIHINAPTNPAHPSFKWGFQLGDQWRKFGIDVNVDANEQSSTVDSNGSFDVSGAWPMWANGGDWDLFSVMQQYHSKYLVPLGTALAGGETARFSTPELDKIIDQMEQVPSLDPKSQQLSLAGLKVLVKYQPGISLGSYVSVLGWDEYYWTNYPGGGNQYTQPHYHWPNFKFMLPRLKPTGKQ